MIFEEEIEDFTVHMKHKLLVHKNKGGYERLKVDELMKMLHAEVRELKVAIDEKDMVGIVDECADVANFAMFISSVVQNRRMV